jgi:hypothetical protein
MSDENQREVQRTHRAAGDEGYDIQYLSLKTGISPEQARVLIRLFGHDRRKLEEEARNLI